MSNENKKIEDYLHLYLGCEIMDECNAKVGKLVGVDPFNTCPVVVQHATIWHLNYHEIKPILRPLSDMQKEEMQHLGYLQHFSGAYQSMCLNAERITTDTRGFRIWSTDRNYDDTRVLFNSLNAKQFAYLLKQGFDLFDLIESGLAIDKSTLNVTPS